MKDELKTTTARLPKSLWQHIRKHAYEDETSNNEALIQIIKRDMERENERSK